VHAWRDRIRTFQTFIFRDERCMLGDTVSLTGCIQTLRFMWTAAVDEAVLVLRSRKIWTVLVLRVPVQEKETDTDVGSQFVPNEREPMGKSIWLLSSTGNCRVPGAMSVFIVISLARSFLLYVRLSRILIIVHWFTADCPHHLLLSKSTYRVVTNFLNCCCY
jgi:hypothetical protein